MRVNNGQEADKIGKTISHYKILEKLGEGGMGVVYKAQDTKLDRVVAIKFLPQHLTTDSVEKERFVHEAKAASALNHTNVTTIHEIDEFNGQTFMVMEYCEGKTLRQVIEKETLSIKKVLDIGIQICEGLTIAHEKGIVHRDIKSDNIMFTPRGQVKIMDFGLAKLKGATKLTQSRSTLGTASYMSPEQAQREEVDHRSDIFSFGVVLYELLTGQLPFQGEHEAAVLHAIISEEPQPVARFNNKVSAKLQNVVEKALAKEKDERYQHIDDVLADLRREKKSLEYVKTTHIPPEAVPPKRKKKLLPFIVPASIVFIVVLLFLILKPFKFEIGPEERAIAKENSLAVMYFENLVDAEDQDKTAQMITALLITDLSESQYMRVVSRQRLYDILELLGKQDLQVIDKTVASKVAQKAGVKWILTGSILQTEPNIVLTSDISEAATGEILATQRIAGETGEDLFSVVDKLSAQIKEDLSLPEQAKKELDRPVADVTTNSPEAYRYYLEGLDYYNKLYWKEAGEAFKRALEFDSTFAMAYYGMALHRYFHERGKLSSKDKRHITKAVEYSDKVSEKEKAYIRSFQEVVSGNYREAIKELQKAVKRYPQEKEAPFYIGSIYWLYLRELENAIDYFNRAIEVYPLYKLAYNYLAYTYDEIGNFEKSIWAINKYISLAPDEANPYDTRGDLYAINGKIDQAIESYKKAVKIKPDLDFPLGKLGAVYLFKGEYDKAESCYQKLSSSSQRRVRSEGRTYLAIVPLYQGKFEEALRVLNDGIVADRLERVEGSENASKYLLKASIYQEKKNLTTALEEIEKALEIFRKTYSDDPTMGQFCYIQLLAESGDIAKAREVAKTLKKDIEEKDQTFQWAYWYAVGCIELAEGKLEESITDFERATKTIQSFNANYSQVHLLLSKTYLESGRLGEAVAVLENALSRYDYGRAFYAIGAVKAYYLLGLAYEKSGWNKKAIEQYEEFLEIWKDADPGIHEVEDAKQRLAQLKSKT